MNKLRCAINFVAVVLLTPLSDSSGAVKTKFELVITLKGASRSAFTISPNVLARADKVIG